MGFTFSLKTFIGFFLTCGFVLTAKAAGGQTGLLTRYLDSSLKKTTRENAFYITERLEENNIYTYTRYLAQSKEIVQKSFYLDSALTQPVGLWLQYYENGRLKDSVEYGRKSKKTYAFHYYPNGQLICHYSLKTKDADIEGFDENGKKTNGFVYEKEAEFFGGNKAWMDYLNFKLRNKDFSKKGAPPGNYRVIVRFIIDKNGEISSVSPVTSHGYGMEEELMKVIKKAPKWEPAMYLNKPINAYREQPITITIEFE